jgi:replicative DNA helicase
VNAHTARFDVTQPPRDLPHNIEVEQALIGCVLANNEAFMRVSSIVTPDHFWEEMHQTIWSVIAALMAKGQGVNPILLKSHLGNPELAPGKTLLSYLTGLASDSTGWVHAESYAKTVQQLAILRQIIDLAERLKDRALAAPVDATTESIFAEGEDAFESLRPIVSGKRSGFASMSRVAESTMRQIQDEWNDTTPKRTIRYGFPKLDEKLGGLAPPDLVIIAGRPASGKTSLAVDVAVNAGRQMLDDYQDPKERGVVAVFSMEMSKEQLTERIMSRDAGVVGTRIRRRQLAAGEVTSLCDSSRRIERLPIEIDDTGDLGIAQILVRARSLHKKHRIRLLVIDYLQLIRGFRAKTNESKRHEELGEITGALKGLCKELNIPCILLSQVGRHVDQRDNKRPNKSDLKESGSIEQDADSILLIYREESYLYNDRPMEGTNEFIEWERKLRKVEGIAEVIIGKNRSGPQTTLLMGYDGPHTMFMNDPAPRSVEPDEARQHVKKVALTPYGKDLKAIILGLAVSIGRKPTTEDMDFEPRMPRGALLIPLDQVRAQFEKEVMPDAEEKVLASKFQSAIDNLRRAGLLSRYQDMNEIAFLFLPELIAE